MSRQSKARRVNATKKQYSELRKKGGKGPERTVKVHTKKNCWYKKRKLANTSKVTEDARDKVSQAA